RVGKHILLVEPDYYTRFPPLGLLKLARYHKEVKKDEVTYVRGCVPEGRPDLIYVTSLFTWAWKPVHEAVKYYKRLYPEAEVWLGGVYATLLPDHAEQSGAKVYRGLFKEAEDLMPMYELIPKWDGSIIFSSRGCIRKCSFCAVPVLEGGLDRVKKSIKHLVYPKHTRIIFWDNNILASSNWRSIMDELEEMGKKVDFNQGLDARLISDEVAERLSKLRMEVIRIAYDQRNMRKAVQRAIERLSAYGIKKRKILCYTLYNFKDDPQDLFERVRDLLNWGVVAYPMRYQPILELPYALEKNTYVAPRWDKKQLEIVARLRRVVGFGGTFPPYKALVDRFNGVRSFEEMLYPPRKEPKLSKQQMTLEMKPVEMKHIQRQKPRWGGELDWMKNLNAH
ncbi:MAG: B12-binding domain-containing radical SAM protein, partial [Nitrososphaerales archaeon]